MKPNTTQQVHACFRDIEVSTIIFDETDFVTLWASTRSGKAIHLGCDFDMLSNLLKQCGPDGKTLEMTVAELLLDPPYEMPVVLEMNDYIGSSLSVSNLNIMVHQPPYMQAHNRKTSYLGIETYMIHKVFHGNKIKPANRTHHAIGRQLAQEALQLGQLYVDYLDMIVNGYDEPVARKIMGLENPTVFASAQKAAEIWKG